MKRIMPTFISTMPTSVGVMLLRFNDRFAAFYHIKPVLHLHLVTAKTAYILQGAIFKNSTGLEKILQIRLINRTHKKNYLKQFEVKILL